MKVKLWDVKVCRVVRTCGHVQVEAETRGDAEFLAQMLAHEVDDSSEETIEIESCEPVATGPIESRKTQLALL